jgi:hypothetical protein
MGDVLALNMHSDANRMTDKVIALETWVRTCVNEWREDVVSLQSYMPCLSACLYDLMILHLISMAVVVILSTTLGVSHC